MTGTPGGAPRPWFVVLPDHALADGALTAFRRNGVRVVRHASGRPWLVGRWDDEDLVVVTAGPVRLAVAGVCSATPDHLLRTARTLSSVAALDTAAARWAGSFHLIASAHGRVRVQGTASGLRRIYTARLGGIAVAADRSDVLAHALGTAPDPEALALRLLTVEIPHPLDTRSAWAGVEPVEPGTWLRLDGDGTAHRRRWWTPPDPVLPLAEGGHVLRRELATAVDLRTRDGGTVSADLSGGLDSTPLCFLADRGPARLIALTRTGIDPGHDDAHWARLAGARLHATQHVVPPGRHPAWFTDADRSGRGLDEPTLGVRNWAELRHTAQELTSLGSRLHLSGEGGDQVLLAARGYLHDLLRRRPATGWRHLRATAARLRWRPSSLVTAALDGRGYARWLAATAADLTPRPLVDRVADLGWASRAALPSWATPAAADAVRRALVTAARDHVPPLAPTRGGHGTLSAVRATTAACRNLARISGDAGLPLHHPFLDDRVLSACLATRQHERTSPFAYKPLVAAAMRGIVPDELLARRTKGAFSAELHTGLHHNRPALAALCDEPVLAALGLVDADALRDAVLASRAPGTHLPAVETTLAVEAWLRHVTDRHTPTTPEPAHP